MSEHDERDRLEREARERHRQLLEEQLVEVTRYRAAMPAIARRTAEKTTRAILEEADDLEEAEELLEELESGERDLDDESDYPVYWAFVALVSSFAAVSFGGYALDHHGAVAGLATAAIAAAVIVGFAAVFEWGAPE